MNSPPGCSVCALLSCSRTPRAQTARSHSRLHPRIPLFIRSAGTGSRLLPAPRSRWRKERDSNPRRLSPQRFSRPPRSTAPPSFRIGRLKWQPFFVVFRRYLAYSSAAPAYKLRSQAAPHIQSTLLNGVPHAKLRSQAAPRFQSPFKRRSQRCAPRKKSAKVPAPECVPMTFPT